jgi:opacity protein-like surface antigen
MMISLPSRSVSLGIALALSAPLSALAEDGSFYVRAFGGASSLSSTDMIGSITGNADFDTGTIAGGAIGYDYKGSPFRSEIEWTYRSADAQAFGGGATGDFASTTLSVVGYYDLAGVDPSGQFTPYVGLGIGIPTQVDLDISGGTAPGEYTDNGGAAWQAILGAAWAVNDRWALTGELRYFDAGSRDLSSNGNTLTADYQTVDVALGLRLSF